MGILEGSTTFGIVISLIGYEFGVFLKKKFKFPFLNPLLISIIVVVLVLVTFKIDYRVYNSSAKYLSYLLTPATVSLAVPLYKEISLLKKNFLAITLGIAAGVIANALCILLFSLVFKLGHTEYVTLLPKSITTAIGMGLSEEFGGNVNITVAVIIMTGIIGNIFAETVCKLFRIISPISRGIAIGTASHAIGTAKAMEMDEVCGAMSSLSIVVCGILTLVSMSIFSNLL